MPELDTSQGKPNLTPILDMVFQLMTFFVMVANFQATSVERDLNLPVVGSARPVDTKGTQSLLILNIDNQGTLKVFGRPQPIDDYIRREAEAVLLAARRTQPELSLGDELPTMVVVRADRTTPFKLFNRVIRACQQNGFRKFALKAFDKEQGAPARGKT